MLVFWEQRLVLLATPKTGSTALAAALESCATLSVQRPPVLRHTNALRHHRFVGPWLAAAAGQEFTVVAVMREPRAWLGSWYRFRRRDDVPEPSKSTQGMDFDAFVRAYCRIPPPEFAAVGAQSLFLRPPGGRGADLIFRYEEPAAFLRFLEERLERRIDLPVLNVSPPAALDLSTRTEALLGRHAAADFALYASLGTGGIART